MSAIPPQRPGDGIDTAAVVGIVLCIVGVLMRLAYFFLTGQ